MYRIDAAPFHLRQSFSFLAYKVIVFSAKLYPIKVVSVIVYITLKCLSNISVRVPSFVSVIKLKVQNVIENLTARNTNRKFQLNFISGVECAFWLVGGGVCAAFSRSLVSLDRNCDNIRVSLILNYINSWNDANLNRFWRARTNIDTMKNNHVNWHAYTSTKQQEIESEYGSARVWWKRGWFAVSSNQMKCFFPNKYRVLFRCTHTTIKLSIKSNKRDGERGKGEERKAQSHTNWVQHPQIQFGNFRTLKRTHTYIHNDATPNDNNEQQFSLWQFHALPSHIKFIWFDLDWLDARTRQHFSHNVQVRQPKIIVL